MTPEQLAGAIIFFLTVSGVLWGIWWRIEGKVKEAKNEASLKGEAAAKLAGLAREEVQSLRLHVAEAYVSKQGHRESTEQIMSALSNVKTAIDGTNQRIDRLFENPPAKRSPRS